MKTYLSLIMTPGPAKCLPIAILHHSKPTPHSLDKPTPVLFYAYRMATLPFLLLILLLLAPHPQPSFEL
jgi:hypothetical protein